MPVTTEALIGSQPKTLYEETINAAYFAAPFALSRLASAIQNIINGIVIPHIFTLPVWCSTIGINSKEKC